MAAVLWAAVDDKISFLTVAIPRFAGKTTMSMAVLDMRAPDVPLQVVYGRAQELEDLKRERRGGYLVVPEFAQAPMPGYIWGEPVRRVFETVVEGGYSLQSALHARGVEEAIADVVVGNGVTDEQASTFKLVLYIERFGYGYDSFWRRLTDLYEVHKVENGRPVGQSLFRWDRDADRFEKLSDPHQFGRDPEELARRAAIIQRLVDQGRTSKEDVEAALAEYRSTAAKTS
jgi:hypothetical protein